MTAQASTQSRPIPVARERAASPGRIVMLDALRGVALLLMALDHASFFVGAGLQAESYGGQPVVLQSVFYWGSGLLTNLASPIFWLLSGLSLALLEASRRAKQVSERAITRFMLIRAAVVLALDLTICNLAWMGSTPYVHVLTTMAIAMALLSVMRLLPTPALAALALAALLGYQAWLGAAAASLTEPQSLAQAIWLTYSYDTRPAIGFPVLGWGPLMWLGFVLGRRLDAPALLQPRAWAAIGAALLVLWLGLRIVGGYGDLGPFRITQPLSFLIMSKAPPSLTYMAFNLGIASLILAAFYAWPRWLDRAPLGWLVIVGQVSLFFYVAHLVVYSLIARLGAALPHPHLPAVIWGYLTWTTGLIVLVPLARAYRSLRRRHPQSILRYL